MFFCKKCVMPNTRPGISFNEHGVCSACQSYEKRKSIDWDSRWKEFEKICIYLEGGTIFEKSKKLRDLFPMETEDGQHRIWVEFLNKNRWCQNEFQVSNQITVEGRKTCRYDVTILINGLPLVQIELKKRGVELKQAYNQVQRYQKTSFRGLFDYIQIFVISNGVNTRYFANNPNCGYKFGGVDILGDETSVMN